jgi:hypothetical protein
MMLRERKMGYVLAGAPGVRRTGSSQLSRSVRPDRLSLMLKLIIVGLFLPEELSFYIFGLRLTVIRLLFLVVVPLLVVRFSKKLSAGNYRFIPSDLLVVAAGCWLIYAPANVDDPFSALNHAGPTVLEFCVGYFVTRLILSEKGAALSFANVFCLTVAIVAWIGSLDPLTNSRFIHDFAAQLTAPMHSFLDWSDAYRFGLLRASGPVEHPILFGFICAIGLLVALAIPVRARLFVIVSCCMGTMISFSSAPIQVMIMGLALLVYDKLLAGLHYRWSILIGVAIAAVVAAFTFSSNPVGFVISHLTFSPESGYYREWTWALVDQYVSQSPWFGLGFGELPEEINHSIDSLWLVLSIQAGVPGAVLVGLSLIGATPIFTRGREPGLSSEELRLKGVIGIVLFLTIYISFTVHLWGTAWILTGLLVGVKAHLSELGYLASRLSAPREHWNAAKRLGGVNVSRKLRPVQGG